ncbi:Major Facilitator Superfamily protein [Mucilaginibacter pineti]|uniref:Major Facilitator Superfamily protein n=1 Tax=Mucilaginibacter pineti TaxID=1391627 RepID=A0A1G7H7E6_9SPHI|nr:MFS transporter [Mucilaginibacter pineti]SDE96357.1 Major Facilitator Superfamily protein [Mucilaginibacter pineti]
MNLRPSETITNNQLTFGLKLVIADGLSAEAMVVFTSGTFLTAMAIHMGASNFQLGLLAALPTFTTIFQLASIWLVQKFNNRKIISALFNLLARLPLLAIGIMPLLFKGSTTIQVLLVLLFFQHIFGDIAGASWNAWMKDLIPGERLGSFFSRRSRIAQTLNVTLSLATAICIDYVKTHYPAQEITAYTTLFLAGGALGMFSVFLLLRTPEPKPIPIDGKVLKLFSKAVTDKNFRHLLAFNSLWAFALNLATPFFAVFMMKTIGLPLSYVIALGIISQLSSIASLQLWGRYSDRFSNKTIIRVCAPVYITCILAFAFTAMPASLLTRLTLLTVIYLTSGIATAGINLALSNIGIKLAPKSEAIVYITAKSMFVAFFSTIAPMIGGLLADFFTTHQIAWNIQLKSADGINNLKLLNLQGWNYFFLIGGFLAILSLRLLTKVKEQGEVHKRKAVTHMRASLNRKLRKNVSRRVVNDVSAPTLTAKIK